jgi:hypothetical protein
MIQSNQNPKQMQRALKPSKRSRPARHWTLLFIGDHGRVITLKRFKGLMLLVGSVVCASIVLTLGLYFFSHTIIAEKKQLEIELENAEKQLKVLRHEKDVLMTRLVLAESRTQEASGGQSEHQATAMSANQVEAESTDQNPATVVAEKKPAVPAPIQSRTEPEIAQSESQLRVDIEDFQLTRLSADNSVQAQFKLKNTSPNSQYVAGHTVVVLKGEQIEPQHWFSLPRVPLEEGKPTGRTRGHTFGINYFKTMRLSTVVPKSLGKVQAATVYVFTRSGELLLEQDFAVNLPSSDAVAATPPSTDSATQIPGEFSTW